MYIFFFSAIQLPLSNNKAQLAANGVSAAARRSRLRKAAEKRGLEEA